MSAGIQSQVESMSVSLQDLGAIKPQVEALSATADTLLAAKSGGHQSMFVASPLAQVVASMSSSIASSDLIAL
jgi:hypothetical protein